MECAATGAFLAAVRGDCIRVWMGHVQPLKHFGTQSA